jgi:hypothetical protein
VCYQKACGISYRSILIDELSPAEKVFLHHKTQTTGGTEQPNKETERDRETDEPLTAILARCSFDTLRIRITRTGGTGVFLFTGFTISRIARVTTTGIRRTSQSSAGRSRVTRVGITGVDFLALITITIETRVTSTGEGSRTSFDTTCIFITR